MRRPVSSTIAALTAVAPAGGTARAAAGAPA
jgi:hypothetical protein